MKAETQLHLEVETKSDVYPTYLDDAAGAAAIDDLPPPAGGLRRYASDGGAPSSRGGAPAAPPALGRQVSLATPSTATSQAMHSWKLAAPRKMQVVSAAKGSTGYHLAVPLPHDEAALGAWLGPDPNVRHDTVIHKRLGQPGSQPIPSHSVTPRPIRLWLINFLRTAIRFFPR